MVPPNGANRNAEIYAPFHPPLARSPRFNAPSPATAGGLGGPLAAEPALGARDGGAGRRGPRCARRPRIPRWARRARLLARIPANPTGASMAGVVKHHAQGLLVRIDDVVNEPLARGRMEHHK